MTHICVSKLANIGSDNGLSPGRRQAIIWTNAGLLLMGPLGTNFNEISIEILTFSFKKMCLKMSSGKRRPFCLGLNVLIIHITVIDISAKCISHRIPSGQCYMYINGVPPNIHTTKMGHVTLTAVTGKTVSSLKLIRRPDTVDFIYAESIFKWAAMTWQGW